MRKEEGAWGWRPEEGRWSMEEHGYPALLQPVSISTTLQRGRDSFEFWREVAFADFEADKPCGGPARGFRARASGAVWESADFFTSVSDALSGSRSRRRIAADGLDSLTVGLVVQGRRDAEQEGDVRVSTAAGSLFVYDGAIPSRVVWSDHKVIYLVIRRKAVLARLGSDIAPVSVLTHRMNASPLGRMLRDQMTSMSRHMASATRVEQQLLLSQAVEVATHAMAPPPAEGASRRPSSADLAQAMAFIERNLADPNLAADRVAREIGCSRATLYRLFATIDGGVAAYIRNRRLDRARALVIGSASSVTIAEIALQCGVYDTSNFSRLFRRRFGAAPTDLRTDAASD